MDEDKNGGAQNPEDFLLPNYETIDVVLPSGFKVKLRHPSDMSFHMAAGSVPGRLAALAEGRNAEITAEELAGYSHRMMAALIVEPKFSLEPRPGEFHPRQLRPADFIWLRKFSDGGGAVELERFRAGAAGPASGNRASGEGIRVQAEPDHSREQGGSESGV